MNPQEPRLTGTELSEQVHNPSHVFIEHSPGNLVKHGMGSAFDPPTPWAGQPIRFTMLAARRMLANGGPLYVGAKLIPA